MASQTSFLRGSVIFSPPALPKPATPTLRPASDMCVRGFNGCEIKSVCSRSSGQILCAALKNISRLYIYITFTCAETLSSIRAGGEANSSCRCAGVLTLGFGDMASCVNCAILTAVRVALFLHNLGLDDRRRVNGNTLCLQNGLNCRFLQHGKAKFSPSLIF